MTDEKDKKVNIILGITGGISAYKSAELVRLMKKEGFQVKVVMTENATRFITPLTMAVLSENKVYTRLFSPDEEDPEIRHIFLARWANMLVIAPASADVISKLAHGIADDLLSTTMLAFQGEVIIAPAMNKVMINNSILRNNIGYLRRKGYHFIETEKGDLACGEYGDGRMTTPANIISFIKKIIGNANSLNGKTILITAAATREPIDQVRFISNYSSGKMGFALAEVAKNRGAKVILVSGPTFLQDIEGIKTIRVNTAAEMREQVLYYFDEVDVFISAAAVSDFRPVNQFKGKIKKEEADVIRLELRKNVDILKEVGEKKGKQILIGFAAEVKKLKENALSKLKSKNLDYIVANDISREDSGFGADTNKVLIIERSGKTIDLPLMSKYEVAEYLFDLVKSYFEHQSKAIIV
ncbi:MAG: bifunctional phosphopantothenoylcysteine decarboxylase/phosphopantothenate--cysteine ligase CoaBC [Atribacterota bacterium]|nr:bifunctional phosphopantothenoylcysteine decarboxylase/phosphopantothenate--cysteine ligase CoaBC [Atribacterota bacterium]MDD4896078.1 bifunctional phosphopantothenoylcysteine decarboxylase/phosphopantothenate--cysteine ligase CoaBC [Atribacterota bacterium]MDD5636378.1 bifunctional phosphopantothenoylcysteine decarboxylase/phosphopantothenate--cysteine ligase CoaBC [Atribacterota bacterium]